ncbi:MAG: selenium-dependent molybdenum cofactor biosynthesis protein YqeB [Anaeromicrobium sp.]|jgi:xanthine dehydrogenase accessory factor|uniref:selenium-dependent molybdenum cofactor biosynthesis protein YqeB n=1 Tax=Anaeromicrobium sp. TaxID=1929132 RepID=UPI0025EF7703|nr:selenium-dependent molybdenum cofactor biosynthesis protein YqeB [Anaeromicrobium sp.]MCT4592877.1 selenium-dependent molybdenum cofactor biosynthesis protein YqeB [Anaeromicrobium sp.]
MLNKLVIIRGAGDLATAIGHRLFKVGFKVVMTEIDTPKVVRRTVSFANCVYEGNMLVEGVESVKTNKEHIYNILNNNKIPVVVDPQGTIIKELKAHIVIDAIMAKKNMGTSIEDAPIVIGIGPGFEASVDVHAIVETMRGHDLGRVIYEGKPKNDTGVPGPIGGYDKERLLRSPCHGEVITNSNIGDLVKKGQIIGEVQGKEIRAQIDGVLRGLIKSGTYVKENEKVGDIDPRGEVSHCYTISDKGRNIAGGALEALLTLMKES